MDDLGDLLAHSRMVVPEIARRVVELKVFDWVFLRCGSFKRMGSRGGQRGYDQQHTL